MKSLSRESGFTLVEIVIALAILMIILLSFTQLYTSSISGIFKAGKVSEELFRAQKEMDNNIAEGSAALPEDPPQVIIEFQQHTVVVDGEMVFEPYEYEQRSGNLIYFLPEGQ